MRASDVTGRDGIVLGFVGTSRDVARVARRPWDERDACWMRACD